MYKRQGPNKDSFTAQAKKNETDAVEIQKEAKKLDEESAAKLAEGAVHEHRHHILTIAVTFLHVGIAMATIAIVTGGKRWPWYTSMVLGAAGLLGTAYAYLPLTGH